MKVITKIAITKTPASHWKNLRLEDPCLSFAGLRGSTTTAGSMTASLMSDCLKN